MTDRFDVRRKRALFRSVRRGTKESDALLGGFAESRLAVLSEAQLGRLEALLDCNDADILAWVAGTRTTPPEHDHDVMAMLVAFNRERARP